MRPATSPLKPNHIVPASFPIRAIFVAHSGEKEKKCARANSEVSGIRPKVPLPWLYRPVGIRRGNGLHLLN